MAKCSQDKVLTICFPGEQRENKKPRENKYEYVFFLFNLYSF